MIARVKKCLADAVAAKTITKVQADEAMNFAKTWMAGRPGSTQGQAAAAAAAALKQKAAEARHQAARQVVVAAELTARAEAHPNGFAAGVRAILARDLRGQAEGGNLEGRIRAVRGELHARFASGLDQYRSKMAGLTRDMLGLKSMVRELFGESTGDGLARVAAAEWTKAAEYGMARFNMAGGTMHRLDTWRLPQPWDDARVRAAGGAEFTRWMHEQLAAGRLTIVDWTTGHPVAPARAAEIIADAYETISTNGTNKIVPGQQRGAKLANARQERRAFEWTSADAYFGFIDKFGQGEARLFDTLVGHLDGMARDIGMLETLGPNPAAMVRILGDIAEKKGASKLARWRIDATYEHASGIANDPVSEAIATGFRGVRAWLASSQLGSAFVSSVNDFKTLTATASWNGMAPTAVLGRYLSLMNPANAADRKLAVRLGLIAESWTQNALAGMRFQLDEMGTGLAPRIADTVLRMSLLTPHTQAGRHAFGLEFLGHLADQKAVAFDALDEKLQRAMRLYGVTPEMWNLARSKGIVDEGGVEFVSADALARAGGRAEQEAASRILEMVHEESRFAVIEPGAAERAMMLGRTEAGTWAGEALRSTMQYKAFPVSMITRHAMRGLASNEPGRYLVGMAVGLTLYGALSLQLKQVATGKDPRDMTDWRFWLAAFAQGGGGGIFGDFLYTAADRGGQSFVARFFGGPIGGLADDLQKLTGANLATLTAKRQPGQRELDTHAGRELARFVQRNTPGTSLWYARLALDRMLWDRLQELSDPDWRQNARKIHDKARKEYGQRFWWGPADPAPRRGPDLGAALGPP